MSSFVRGNQRDAPSSSSPTITLPGTPSVGDPLVITVWNTLSTSFSGVPTDTQGNVWHLLAGSPDATTFVTYWAISLGGGGAYTATCHLSSASETLIVIGEYVGPTSAAFDSVNSGYQNLVCTTTPSFVASAGELATLSALALVGTVNMTGPGVVQRENLSSFLGLGDFLSTTSGTNIWSCGNPGCCNSNFYVSAILFKTPSTAPKSVLFDAMNE